MTLFLRGTSLPDGDHFIGQFSSHIAFDLNRVMQQGHIARLDLLLTQPLRFNISGIEKRQVHVFDVVSRLIDPTVQIGVQLLELLLQTIEMCLGPRPRLL
ncbi:hypothetical protein D3C84_807630 [compost metagenome]